MSFAPTTTASRLDFASSLPSPSLPQPISDGASEKFQLGHRPELDSSRGLAVLFVREPAGTLVAAMTVGLVFVVAAASYYLIERPCLRVKTFFARA